MHWSSDHIEALRGLLESGHSYRDVAERLSDEWGVDLTWDNVRNAARRNQIRSKAQPATPPNVERYDKCFRLSGDWAIVGDLHSPFTDWGLAGQVGGQAQKHDIDRLLVAGDAFEFAGYSRYAALVPSCTQGDEQAGVRYMIDVWRETFKEIRFISGNHDARLMKLLNGTIPADTIEALFMSLLGNPANVHYSLYHYAIIDTPQGEWRITHPQNYSRNALAVARKLAHKYRQHIACLHVHHSATGIDDSGQFVIADIGCLADPQKLAWTSLFDSASTPVMNQGFALLKDGQLKNYSNHPAMWN